MLNLSFVASNALGQIIQSFVQLFDWGLFDTRPVLVAVSFQNPCRINRLDEFILVFLRRYWQYLGKRLIFYLEIMNYEFCIIDFVRALMS